MRKKTIFLILMIITMNIFAEEKEVVAVLDFSAINVEKNLSDAIKEIVTSNLIDSNIYKVVERERIKELYSELSLQQTDDFDDVLVQEMGKLLGAELVIFGGVNKIGNIITINIRGVAVETGVARFSKKVTVENENEIINAVDTLINLVSGQEVADINFDIIDDLDYTIGNEIIRRYTGVFLNEDYERVFHQIRMQKIKHRIIKKNKQIVILNSLGESKVPSYTYFYFNNEKLLSNVFAVIDVEEDNKAMILNKIKLEFKRVFRDKFKKIDDNQFLAENDDNGILLTVHKTKLDRFILIQIFNSSDKMDSETFIYKFAKSSFYLDASIISGFDYTVGGMFSIDNNLTGGAGAYYGMTFYLNKIFSLGFGIGSGFHYTVLYADPYDIVLGVFLNTQLRLKVGDQVQLFKFILEPGFNNYIDINLNKYKYSMIQLTPGFNLGFERRFNNFSFEFLTFLGLAFHFNVIGTPPIYENGISIKTDNRFRVGFEFRWNFLKLVKRK